MNYSNHPTQKPDQARTINRVFPINEGRNKERGHLFTVGLRGSQWPLLKEASEKDDGVSMMVESWVHSGY